MVLGYNIDSIDHINIIWVLIRVRVFTSVLFVLYTYILHGYVYKIVHVKL